MTKKRFCDICESEIVRTKWRGSQKPAKGEGSITAKTPLRRRFFQWLSGPYYKYKEWGTGTYGGASIVRIDVCRNCRDDIREQIINES